MTLLGMRALGLEPQPPYPKGRRVEQGDLSLLDVSTRPTKNVGRRR